MTDEQTAEDVLQDALLRALRAYPRLRHADHLRAWLYRVTTTTALDLHRARRREVVTDEPPLPRPGLVTAPLAASSPSTTTAPSSR